MCVLCFGRSACLHVSYTCHCPSFCLLVCILSDCQCVCLPVHSGLALTRLRAVIQHVQELHRAVRVRAGAGMWCVFSWFPGVSSLCLAGPHAGARVTRTMLLDPGPLIYSFSTVTMYPRVTLNVCLSPRDSLSPSVSVPLCVCHPVCLSPRDVSGPPC